MKPTAEANVCQASNDGLHTLSPQESSRYVAWVSAAGAIVWGAFLAAFAGSPSDGFLPLVLWVTVHHIGQAVTSAISFKAGAAFAFFALAALIPDAMFFLFNLISNFENDSSFAVLTTPATCSACALIIARRHSETPHNENVG